MCGIAGILSFNEHGNGDTAAIKAITDAMAHRGPDAVGLFQEGPIALGHRRLSIIDLSSAGNQPFESVTGRFVIVFNGEIYNYKAIRGELVDYPFKSHSDTEVVLAAYEKWGDKCLSRFRGMFAFAIWDRVRQELFLAKDRLGVKPLYYCRNQSEFQFASEVRSLLQNFEGRKSICYPALWNYLHYQSVPFPYTMVEGIQQLEAGHWMRIRDGKMELECYWDIAQNKIEWDWSNRSNVLNRTHKLLVQSVERRMVSDVPVGAFLSGGIDSSAVVGLMSEAGAAHPNTFNICFDEKEYDESIYADLVAKKFATHHSKVRLKPESFLDQLEEALSAMDSPSGDGINTFVVSKEIRKAGIKVALSGVGGDELFAGYGYFKQFMNLRRHSWLWKFPAPIRSLFGKISFSGNSRVQRLLKLPEFELDQVYSIFREITEPSRISHLVRYPEAGPDAIAESISNRKARIASYPYLSQFSIAEYLGYTQHTLLKDTDQMSMAVSLEVREPFFDQDLLEFVLSVPDDFKMGNYPKKLLIDSLGTLIPNEIVHRPKKGFLFPWKEWMKRELASFCQLHIDRLSERSFVQGSEIRRLWQAFQKSDPRVRWTELWLLIVLEFWLEKNKIDN